MVTKEVMAAFETWLATLPIGATVPSRAFAAGWNAAIVAIEGYRLPDPSAAYPKAFSFDGWHLEIDRRELTDTAGTYHYISSGEFSVLRVLCTNSQRLLSRDDMLALLGWRSGQVKPRSVDVWVTRLRQKIEADPHRPSLIKTVRYGGYFFAPEVTAS